MRAWVAASLALLVGACSGATPSTAEHVTTTTTVAMTTTRSPCPPVAADSAVAARRTLDGGLTAELCPAAPMVFFFHQSEYRRVPPEGIR